jgi:anti-anti-sigma factor
MTLIDNVLVHKQPRECTQRRGATVSVESVGPTTVISVSGEVDASNVEFVGDVLDSFATRRGRIVVDCSRLEFVAAQGVRLLIGFDNQCQQRDIVWALVPCRILSRLLQVADVQQVLPVAESVDDARLMLESVEASPAGRALQRVDPEKLRC